MIQKLASENDKWLRIAYNICGCRDMAGDIVQDMYLKLHNSDKEVNANYVTMTMRSIFIDGKRKQKEYATDEFEQIQCEDPDYDKANEQEVDYEIVKSVFESLPWHQRAVIQYSYVEGVRKFSRESKIYVDYITKARNNFKEKTWQALKQKRNNQELEMLLHQSLQQLESSRARVAIKDAIFLM